MLCAGYSGHPFGKEAHERGMDAPSLTACGEQETERRSRETKRANGKPELECEVVVCVDERGAVTSFYHT